VDWTWTERAQDGVQYRGFDISDVEFSCFTMAVFINNVNEQLTVILYTAVKANISQLILSIFTNSVHVVYRMKRERRSLL
jgi:hypothetical protein